MTHIISFLNKQIETIEYTGYNYSEVNKFTGNKLAYYTEEKDWSDSNPPKDLVITLRPFEKINKGDFICKTETGECCVISSYAFKTLFS